MFLNRAFIKPISFTVFGRNEDVPEGFNISLTGGWLKKTTIKKTLWWH